MEQSHLAPILQSSVILCGPLKKNNASQIQKVLSQGVDIRTGSVYQVLVKK